jgi:nucleotidyltransferase/DNA polymerase involved in DNA repair
MIGMIKAELPNGSRQRNKNFRHALFEFEQLLERLLGELFRRLQNDGERGPPSCTTHRLHMCSLARLSRLHTDIPSQPTRWRKLERRRSKVKIQPIGEFFRKCSKKSVFARQPVIPKIPINQ